MTNSIAFNLYSELQACLKQQAGLFLKIGYILKQIRDNKLYLQIGEGGFDTFTDFLDNPEIGLKRSTSMSYIRVYEYYIEKLGMTQEQIASAGIAKLQNLLPVVKEMSDEKAIELIETAVPLGGTDYKKLMVERGIYTQSPTLYLGDNGKWVFEFNEHLMERILNKDTGETLWQSTKA